LCCCFKAGKLPKLAPPVAQTLGVKTLLFFASLGQADKHFIVDRWVHRYRHRSQVHCEEEQSGAVIVITCMKTIEWHDALIQSYSKNCAWLQAITEAVKEVGPLLTYTFTHSLITHS